MDPLTAMIIAGTLTTAVGSIKQAQAASSAFKFNARTGTANAAGARAAAAENERRERRLGLKRMGILRVGGQTSLDLLEDAAMEEELNALSTRYEGDLQALGLGNTATLDRLRSKSAKTEGYASAAGTLLSGGGKVYDRIYGDEG